MDCLSYPPTSETVGWILRGTDRPPEEEIGKFLPRGGIVTYETLAVALAMAGGRPEYLPVLDAIVRAVLDPACKHEGWQATSASTFPTAIVNGPVSRQIRINHSFGLVGPDPRHPAGASIGRALRLLQQNVGGALPGIGTMAMFGGMRYTNAVFAEDELGLPHGWETFNTERFGLAAGTNSVALNVCSSVANIMRRGMGTETLQQEAEASLLRIASHMRSCNPNSFASWTAGTPGIVILSSQIARQLAGIGWTKQSIRDYLWRHARIPGSELEKAGLTVFLQDKGVMPPYEDPWPVTARPENIAIVVAGGMHPTHSYWMQTALTQKMLGREIELPAKWADLVAEADAELGYLDDAGLKDPPSPS